MIAAGPVTCYDRVIMMFMFRFICRMLLSAAGIYAADYLLEGFTIKGGWEIIIFGAFILALLNTFLKPILRFLTTPIRWLTLGLFNIVIAMTILKIAVSLTPQISIDGILTLLAASIILMFANSFF